MSLDSGLAIFKRFDELNAHSLFFQQAHLLKLKADLKYQQEADRQYDELYNKYVQVLVNKRAEQWKLHVEIRQRLEMSPSLPFGMIADGYNARRSPGRERFASNIAGWGSDDEYVWSRRRRPVV